MLVDIKEYDDQAIAICPDGTMGDHKEIGGLLIVLPKAPKVKEILFHNLPVLDQYWL